MIILRLEELINIICKENWELWLTPEFLAQMIEDLTVKHKVLCVGNSL